MANDLPTFFSSVRPPQCFRLCGICLEQKLEKRPTASNKHDKLDIHHLLNLRADRDKVIQDPDIIHGAHYIITEGVRRLCVYIDGSCVLPRHRKLAHAGWGVAFSLTSNDWGDCGAIKSEIQTSYRAEVRDIAHALARLKTPALICSDCKAAVTTLQNYLRTKQRPSPLDIHLRHHRSPTRHNRHSMDPCTSRGRPK